jgi:hypothetical protein
LRSTFLGFCEFLSLTVQQREICTFISVVVGSCKVVVVGGSCKAVVEVAVVFGLVIVAVDIVAMSIVAVVVVDVGAVVALIELVVS